MINVEAPTPVPVMFAPSKGADAIFTAVYVDDPEVFVQEYAPDGAVPAVMVTAPQLKLYVCMLKKVFWLIVTVPYTVESFAVRRHPYSLPPANTRSSPAEGRVVPPSHLVVSVKTSDAEVAVNVRVATLYVLVIFN